MDLIAVLFIGIVDQIIFCPDKAESFAAVLSDGFDRCIGEYLIDKPIKYIDC